MFPPEQGSPFRPRPPSPDSEYPTTTTAANIMSIVTSQNNLPFIPPASSKNSSSRSPIPWSTNLCDCFSDVNSCCLTCWCPCITFGRIAEIVDRGSPSCCVSGALYMLMFGATGCPCLYSCFYRSKLRGQSFLEERPCTDCCLHCCCEGCALCQEYRQLRDQGFQISTGNNDEQWRGLTVPPSVQNGMRRIK